MMETIQTYVLPHWAFLTAAFILAGVGQVMKTSFWTKALAAKSRFRWYMRATLPLHAPAGGAAIAILSHLVGADLPVSPGVEGVASAALYYAGAGAASSWVYVAFKHFAKSRGIELTRASMPPEPK